MQKQIQIEIEIQIQIQIQIGALSIVPQALLVFNYVVLIVHLQYN